MSKPETLLKHAAERHGVAKRQRERADAANLDAKRAVRDALDGGVHATELEAALGLSIVRVYQMARQAREADAN